MTALYILIAGGVLSPVADDPKGDKNDLVRLQGTWKVVSMIDDGKEAPPEKIKGARLIFESDRYALRGGEESFRGSFRIEPGKKPGQIDTTFVNEDGKETGRARGIYELDGKKLRVAWRHKGEGRPAELASKPGSGVRLMVLERE
jgi:uncharacterized protein (TIGR03067 family)